MSSTTDLLRHPSRMLDSAHFPKEHRPAAMGGLVMLVLVGLGLWWLWPEIQRYIRIERM